LRISRARQDPDAERRLIEDAINQKVGGIRNDGLQMYRCIGSADAGTLFQGSV
jgi:hypothetical protein